MATYTDEQIAYMLANGGRLFRANNQLFIVEQTGLIIGPITVDYAAFFTTRNSTQEIYMSGENFKNPLEVVSSTSGLTITNVNVDTRSQITLTINADMQPPKGGHQLEYRTRTGFDSSVATVRNNVVILPAEPVFSSLQLENSRTFVEVGAGLATSEHSAGHNADLYGDQLYDLQQVEDALQDGATLAGLGLPSPAGKDLRVRVGKLDANSGLWADDPDCTVTINSVSESQVEITLDIDSDFSIDAADDERQLDVVIETYSGDLGAALAAENFARSGDNKSYVGSYAMIANAITVRRARPQSFTLVTMLDNAVLPSAGDEASIAAARAAGTELFPNQLADFRQQETKKFLFECQSAHNLDANSVSQDPACLDSSAVLKNTGSSTAPAGGRIHAPAIGGQPSADFTTNGSGQDQLTVLSETAFMVEMSARADQELNTYTMALVTDSSEGDFTVCTMSFDIAAGVFVATSLDIQLVSPEVMSAQGPIVTVDLAGDGLPDGFGVVGHANEFGAVEGSLAITAFPATPGSTDGGQFQLQVSSIEVLSDDAARFDLQHLESSVISYLQGGAGRSVEDIIGNITARMIVTDANGVTQQEELTDIRVQHLWPPEAESIGGDDGENYLREDSLNDPDMVSVDTLEINLMRLRGHHDPSATAEYPLVNGFNAISEFGEHELKLVKVDSFGAIQYDVSTTDQAELITTSDPVGTDKPFILINDLRAAKAGFSSLDSASVSHEVYKWELDCVVVSEEAMEKSAAAPNGLEDVCTDPNYGGQKLALAIRSVNGDADQKTEWEVFENFFEILPANIEMTASSHEVARNDAETVTMSGDNLYPDGSGSGVDSGSDSDYSDDSNNSDSGGSSDLQEAFVNFEGNPDTLMDFTIDWLDQGDGQYELYLSFSGPSQVSTFADRQSSGEPLYIWGRFGPAANIADMVDLSGMTRAEGVGEDSQWVVQNIGKPSGWDDTIIQGRAYENASNVDDGPYVSGAGVDISNVTTADGGYVTVYISEEQSNHIVDNASLGILITAEGAGTGTYSVFVDQGDFYTEADGTLRLIDQGDNEATWDLIITDQAVDKIDLYIQTL